MLIAFLFEMFNIVGSRLRGEGFAVKSYSQPISLSSCAKFWSCKKLGSALSYTVS